MKAPKAPLLPAASDFTALFFNTFTLQQPSQKSFPYSLQSLIRFILLRYLSYL
jgi:hypothetical protein